MPEVSYPGEHHGHARLIGRCDHLVVPHRAARLDHAGGTGVSGGIEPITKREERAGGTCTTDRTAGRLLGRDPAGIPAVLLPGTNSNRRLVLHQNDAVGADLCRQSPGQLQVEPFGLIGSPFGHGHTSGPVKPSLIGGLHQQPAGDGSHLELRFGRRCGLQQPKVLLLRQNLPGLGGVAGRHHHLGEHG